MQHKKVLKPLSLSTKAILNMKPDQENYKSPMFDFTILLESVGLNLNRLQVYICYFCVNTEEHPRCAIFSIFLF